MASTSTAWAIPWSSHPRYRVDVTGLPSATAFDERHLEVREALGTPSTITLNVEGTSIQAPDSNDKGNYA